MTITDWKEEYNHHRRHSSLVTRPQPDTLPTAHTETPNDSHKRWTSSPGRVTTVRFLPAGTPAEGHSRTFIRGCGPEAVAFVCVRQR